MSQYLKFFLMIATSTLVMFVLMYLNSYQLSHVFFSETRTYMAIYMGAAMAVVMLLFMLNMYKDKKKNSVVLGISIISFVGALFLVRSQITVNDQSWMSAMIPHHSIAILTSDRANIKDKRVQELATNIIEAQRREIKEMQWLLNDIEKNGLAETQEQAQSRAVPDFNTK
jgi:thiol:disulfide interchange protein|tara:strand:+ start:1493 stop:2002 length:510 start_codon:yes stop_codon:yes gene_type:complete